MSYKLLWSSSLNALIPCIYPAILHVQAREVEPPKSVTNHFLLHIHVYEQSLIEVASRFKKSLFLAPTGQQEAQRGPQARPEGQPPAQADPAGQGGEEGEEGHDEPGAEGHDGEREGQGHRAIQEYEEGEAVIVKF